MGLYDTFKTDEKKEAEGVWLDYGSCRILIGYAGSTNKKFVSYSEKTFKPLRRAIELGTLDNERSTKIMADVFATTIIRDWATLVGDDYVRGIENPNGGDLLPVNKENVIATLTALPALFMDLQEQAKSIATFRAADMEADSGNSASS